MAAVPSGETAIAEYRVPEDLRQASELIADEAHCFSPQTAEAWRGAAMAVRPDADGFSVDTALKVARNLPWKPLVMSE